MSNTRHRNAGGPFVVFDPGLGISGSLEISGLIGGRTGINPGVQIATDTFVTGTLKVGANHGMSLTDNELDISSGDLTLDVAGNIELNADGGTITFKDDASTLGTITSAGFSGTATAATTVVVSGDYDSDVTQYLLFSGPGTGNPTSVRHDDELTYNPSTGTVTATNFVGNIAGHASSASRVNVTANAQDQSYPILFSGDTSPDGGNEEILADASVTLNPNSNTITATTFAGALSGNATSATALVTGRTLKVNLESTAASTAFDGSGNITDVGVNGTLPVTNGGTGLTSISTLLNSNVTPASLSLEVGTDVQAHSAILDDLAGLTQASNKIPYFNGSSTASTLSFSTSTGLGSSNTTIPSQLAVKTYVDNNAGGGGISMSGGSSNSVTTKNGSNLTAESNLTFNGNTLAIPTIAGSAPAINLGGYSKTGPGVDSGGSSNADANTILGIKQNVSTGTRTASAIAISTNNDSHAFFIFIDGSAELAIGSDHEPTGAGDNGITISSQYFGTNQDVRSDAVSFTGVHRNIPEDFSLQDYKSLHVGKIVVATGEYQNLEKDVSIRKPLIGQALPKIRLASKRNEKSCFGVVSRIEESNTRKFGYGGMVASTMSVSDSDRRVVVNSIGEGGIWVCNINGNLENGDYITTCEVPGLGMRQDTEMLCNYTVAKITQDCNFRINASNYDVEEFEFEGKTYRKAFVGCTYHCG